MNPTITIQTVATQHNQQRFLKLPWKIYQCDLAWCPPIIMDMKDRLNPHKNPFFEHADVNYFLAYRGEEVVGRIAAIIDHEHNRYHDEKTGFWGFYEAIDDIEVAHQLFGAVKNWLIQRGMDNMRGPMSFGTNDECGMLIEGFDKSPIIMMSYNPPYYIRHCETFGMIKSKDLIAFYLDVQKSIPETMQKLSERIRKKYEPLGLVIRPFNKRKSLEEVQHISRIYRSAWKDNWGYVPITDHEIEKMAKNLLMITEPELILFIEYEGQPVGVTGTLYNINEVTHRLRKFDRWPLFIQSILQLITIGWRIYLKPKPKFEWARMLIAGLLPEYRHLGFDIFLYVIPFINGKKLGIRHGELSWELEDNTAINKAINKIGGETYKKYRIWDYPLKP